jgi:hypothetical protein
LVRVLQHRFGPVEARLVESLQPFSLNQLETLTDVALTVASLEAFTASVAQRLNTLAPATEDR